MKKKKLEVIEWEVGDIAKTSFNGSSRNGGYDSTQLQSHGRED